MLLYKIKQKVILKILLTILLLEIVIGGGGRFIEIAGLSLKMIFFAITIVVSFLLVQKIRNNILLKLLFFLLLLLSIATCIGITTGAKTTLIFSDLSPLLFFFIIPFFSLVINDYNDIIYVVKIIKLGTSILAFLYLLLLILLYREIIDFTQFYAWGNARGEIFFRPGSYMFFYKGFLYLCIGFFFHMITIRSLKDKVITALIYLSIVLTLSRGLILMTSIVYIFYILFISKKKWLKFFLFLFGIIAFIYLLPVYLEAIGDKSASDQVRIDTFDQVIDRINIFTIFIGQGFGNGVPIRPERMELSYLEIFHKQGILGLSFWVILLFLNFYLCHKIKKHREIALAFLLSVCFVYLQSFTNPFVNNPIGISIITLSIVCMYKMCLLEKSIFKT